MLAKNKWNYAMFFKKRIKILNGTVKNGVKKLTTQSYLSLWKVELEVEVKEEVEVEVEIKVCISQPRCNHSLCITCFKRCYYGDEMTDEEPIFPYPDIEDEYYDDTENIKWVNDYPLIQLYDEEYNRWEYEKQKKYESEEYLRICSICRK